MAKFEIKDSVAIIPEGTTMIEEEAFSECTSLKCVTLLSHTKLGNDVFSYSSRRIINVPSDCVDYYKEVLPEEFHDTIVDFDPENQIKGKLRLRLIDNETMNPNRLCANYLLTYVPQILGRKYQKI